ncbi:MAG: hypothetical protein A2161_13600 [Candidatus Schekmanbacteria bacterium RBG_13_48_7]|uniref:histidine kinase n=1 Tax=Candidatus Schekmanbacteria bacterium RBG_13_48_7 TaxID=1817878 RepID=A0A1F7RLX7_9BACT|nr:MAG: hypothetical protein A2161_13600 [Candidatus Schekmanbacteria bacterium RBG_13_48_7]
MSSENQNCRILVVDDEEVVLMFLEELLKDEGYGVFAVNNGTDALSQLKENQYDLILTDMNLPDVDGLQILNFAKQTHPQIEVLIITGYASLETAIEAMRLGAYDYLIKPIDDIDLLLEKIKKAYEKGKLSKENYLLLEDLKQKNQALLESKKQIEMWNEELELRVKERTQELKETNDKLTKLDRLKSEFVSMVSHELRTPMSSIKSFTEILLNCPPENIAEQKEFLHIINEETDRLNRIINDILDLDKIEEGKIRWRLAESSVPAVIEKSINASRGLLEKKRIKAIPEIAPDAQSAYMDADRITQVITNLLGNALKFTPEEGKITIKASRSIPDKNRNVNYFPLPEMNYIVISVTDTGPGIPHDQLEKVFEKFAQVVAVESTNSDIKGTGLGLTISRGIVQYHKGRIWVTSTEGQGSTFWFTLPLIQTDGNQNPTKITSTVNEKYSF